MEKLGPDDVRAQVAAIQAAQKRDEDPFEGDADDVIDLAVEALGRRLRDNPDDVAPGTLVKLVEQANKAAERRDAQRAAEAAQTKDVSVLDVVRNSALPLGRKHELINKEIKRLEALIRDLQKELDDE